jgi:hypothetical protein
MAKQDENESSGLLDSISGVLDVLLSAFSIPEEPIEPLPPLLIMVGGKLRPGLSAKTIAARIITRQSEAGLIAGDVFADGGNTAEFMELIRIEEIIDALLNDSVVNVVIDPGVAVMTTGVGNLGAPVVSFGMTTGMGIGNGIIR